MGNLENLLNKFFKHFDITKKVPVDCPSCKGSGFTGRDTGCGSVCDNCAGDRQVQVESLYLRRWYIVNFWFFRIFVHKIARSDDDPDPHDHPWSFLSIILKNGYVDQSYTFDSVGGYEVGSSMPNSVFSNIVRDSTGNVVPSTTSWTGKLSGPKYQFCSPGDIVFRRAEHIHRVLVPWSEPAWTLVFGGPDRRAWGFVKPDRWVWWRQYLNNWGKEHA